MRELKVSSKSNPSSVAGAIAAVVKSDGAVEMVCIGGGAVNQAVKAVAIARGFVVTIGLDLVCTPYFKTTEIDGEERTAIVFRVDDRGK